MQRTAKDICTSYHEALVVMSGVNAGKRAMKAIRETFILPSEMQRMQILREVEATADQMQTTQTDEGSNQIARQVNVKVEAYPFKFNEITILY